MIRGYFSTTGSRRRPFIHSLFEFPTLANRSLDVELLVDTGADRTSLAPLDARRLAARLGVDISALPQGDPSTGVGGPMETRTIEAVLTLDRFSTPITLTILEPRDPFLPIPSLLGRDILFRFMLIVEQRTDRVLLLAPEEARALNLP